MQPFSLLVKPASADCNLRCSYCFYIDRCELYPETARHRMTEAVLERMVSSFLATDQPVHAFGWQGGEPTLMGLDFFKRVTALQERYGRAGRSVSNGLQTNATLLDDDWAEHLRRYNFLVGVSLDGPPEVHDRQRRTSGGEGSHAQVLRGIRCLRERGTDFNILTLVTQANVARPAELYRYLTDQGFLFQQYIECVEFDERGRLRPYALTAEAWGDFLCGIYDAWREHDVRRVSVRLFDSIVHRLVEGTANVCSMGRDCRQYLVVEHNGDVYPCDFFVTAPLRLGNVTQDGWPALLASDRYREFGERKGQWNEACDVCPCLDFCAGGCQKNRWGGGGRPRERSALCEGWRRFYAHALPGLEELAAEVRQERAAAALSARRYDLARSGVPLSRVKRNDPCPCGSGLKFKRCCGR